MSEKRLSKEQLLARYTDATWRERILRLVDLTVFLAESVLARNYKIPDRLNNAIVLSSYGARICQALITKQDVPVKEARVTCLLTLAHTDLLVDIDSTDLDAIRDSINEQVLNHELLFPMVFGRNLYDKAAQLFDDERKRLSYEDTLRLLSDLPVGVFQLSNLVIGPLGVQASLASRWLAPTLDVPMFHCSDLSCDRVHTCRLSTDSGAPINEHRHKIHKLLNAESEDGSAWGAFFAAINGVEAEAYKDQSSATLPYLLGDAFSELELRLIIGALMDNTKGAYRRLVAPLGVSLPSMTGTTLNCCK